jgi:hypothetical protein
MTVAGIHSNSGSQSGEDQQGSDGANREIFKKTKMCRFYLLGACTRGRQCLFAHTQKELNPMPDFSYTRVCKVLRNTGQCNNPDCKYAHSRKELRSMECNQQRKQRQVPLSGLPPTAPRGAVPPPPILNGGAANEDTQVREEVRELARQLGLFGEAQRAENWTGYEPQPGGRHGSNGDSPGQVRLPIFQSIPLDPAYITTEDAPLAKPVFLWDNLPWPQGGGFSDAFSKPSLLTELKQLTMMERLIKGDDASCKEFEPVAATLWKKSPWLDPQPMKVQSPAKQMHMYTANFSRSGDLISVGDEAASSVEDGSEQENTEDVLNRLRSLEAEKEHLEGLLRDSQREHEDVFPSRIVETTLLSF